MESKHVYVAIEGSGRMEVVRRLCVTIIAHNKNIQCGLNACLNPIGLADAAVIQFQKVEHDAILHLW